MTNQAAQTMPELPASVLADLIDWHKRDGTKKGKLTTQALQELAEYRTRAAALSQTAGVLKPLPMDTAPRDGTMVRLLVEFTDHATEDCVGPAWTIGANNDDEVGEDERVGWQFAGWCWTHDHFTEGRGTPVGWLPMLAAAPAASGGEVWTREMIADVHKRGEELFQRINPPAAASVSERERLLLAAACDSVGLYETADGLRANLKGLDLLGIRSKLLAIEQALTQQRGAASYDAGMAMHWIERYAAGIDEECQLDRIAEAFTTPQPSADAVLDGIRMDWLVSKAVEVRDPLRHGSRAMFHAQTASDEDEPHRTTLREQIDAAMADELESLLSGGSHA